MKNSTPNENMGKIWEYTYFILLSTFLLDAFLRTTMFQIVWPAHLHQMMRVVAFLMVFLKLFLREQIKLKKLGIVIGISGFIFLGWVISGYAVIWDIWILMLGAYNISFRKILSVYLAILVPALIVTVIAALCGEIENLTYYPVGRRPRISFGIVYPTDFAAYLFFGFAAYCCWRRTMLRYWEIAGLFVAALFCYYFCDARNSTICLILLGMGCLFAKIWGRIKASGPQKEYALPVWVKKLLPITPLLFAGAIWVLTALYRDSNTFLAWLNGKLSMRLSLGKNGLKQYGLSLLGQPIPMIGNGSSTDVKPDYFFLDSSYILIGMRFGLLILFSICFLYALYILRAAQGKDVLLMIVLTTILLQCMFEHHLTEYVYNPFWLLCFSSREHRMFIAKPVRLEDSIQT